MKIVTNLLGRRVRVYYLDSEESRSARIGYHGIVRLISVSDAGAVTIGLELAMAFEEDLGRIRHEPGTILFLSDRSPSVDGTRSYHRTLALEVLP